MIKKLLISTGGSGGHVIPAIILHEHLSKKNNVIISTDVRGLKFLNKNDYQIEIVNTPKLNNFFLIPLNLFLITFLTVKSFFLLRRKKIEKIFSIGGYMSIPLILAAKLLKLNIYLLEPNQVLGRANKFFLNSCKKIFCYSEKIKNFPELHRDKMIIIKPLVREKIYNSNISKQKNKKFTLLIVGGSQGANIFDKNLKNSIVNISKRKSIKVIHQTSEKNMLNLSKFYSENNIENKIFSFDTNFISTIQQADLCITRAGASTLAELSVLNIPFIAVPLPTSKDNHQLENALFYKNNDCCWIIEQNHFEGEIEHILNVIFEAKRSLLKKKENLKKLNYQNSWINVNQKIIKTVNEN
ncbi:UDP-N-acetylglucosamine--N-acetylmuramyl-(pentapeptide) pyrophosphoryl-undecaprenol N-acetylglucosamine transferase [Candidatus Pelagibacter sp.]|nr:UDP-N-acetylglucosamine--N-acetylmuramyl-(pentapeptide) pyrophosphoryl-undecaprenol N-acetylglucosamine transferase [Candidatus Pelagibacter sp.]